MKRVGEPQSDVLPPGEGTGSVSERRKRYALLLAQGVKSSEAARQSGYSPSYARKGHKLKHGETMQAAMEEAEKIVREVAGYDVTMAFMEINSFIEFAKKHKNAMAYFKAVELKARLAGLLIERKEVVHVDLSKALKEADERIRDISPDHSHLEQSEIGGGVGGGTPKKRRDS